MTFVVNNQLTKHRNSIKMKKLVLLIAVTCLISSYSQKKLYGLLSEIR